MFLYIDATAGGLLLQVLLGGFTGIAVVGRLLWGRIPGLGGKQDNVDQASNTHTDQEHPDHVDDDVRLAG